MEIYGLKTVVMSALLTLALASTSTGFKQFTTDDVEDCAVDFKGRLLRRFRPYFKPKRSLKPFKTRRSSFGLGFGEGSSGCPSVQRPASRFVEERDPHTGQPLEIVRCVVFMGKIYEQKIHEVTCLSEGLPCRWNPHQSSGSGDLSTCAQLSVVKDAVLTNGRRFFIRPIRVKSCCQCRAKMWPYVLNIKRIKYS
ncbi:uncharacterized protein LOC118413310 [Branchiostoma floridae]|uniref:Uncharacterized protein LOC118413310 n=1 Tax=Branchiostoma floridae TaxID=7739 RepID=A0A9J7KYU3_BRAFL|nr:uncharacterized protein LOC118413310 [Branchiostoma floridae]